MSGLALLLCSWNPFPAASRPPRASPMNWVSLPPLPVEVACRTFRAPGAFPACRRWEWKELDS